MRRTGTADQLTHSAGFQEQARRPLRIPGLFRLTHGTLTTISRSTRRRSQAHSRPSYAIRQTLTGARPDVATATHFAHTAASAETFTLSYLSIRRGVIMTAPKTARSGLVRFTRIGFACKGVVYLLIGILALKAAFGRGGETTGKEGAIQQIAAQPFGEFALAVIGIGLLAYAAWRILCGVMDLEHEGDRPTGMAKRIGYFLSGAVYASAGIYALKLLTGNGSGSGGDGTASMTARLMDAPAGTLLVALAGAILIGVGIMQIRNGWTEKFRKHLRMGSMHGEQKQLALRAGKWGYIARGVVFCTMGLLVISAAVRHDPSRARGLEGSLDTLAQQPFGQWLLAFVAAGLICYGAYCFIEARYRQISV
jgi:hypothetical protein